MKVFRTKVFALAGLCALSCISQADWNLTVLSHGAQSEATGGSNSYEVGHYGNDGGIWTGSDASFMSLTPSGYHASGVAAASGNIQVGNADSTSGYWTGTANSFVPLGAAGAEFHTTDAVTVGGDVSQFATIWDIASGTPTTLGGQNSSVYGVFGNQQVGFDSNQAAMWGGTMQSEVSLNPYGSSDLGSGAVATDGTTQVGYYSLASFNGANHACLWTGTANSLTDLNPSSAFIGSGSSAMWGPYQVGFAEDKHGFMHPGFWRGSAGSWFDLYSTLPSQYHTSTVYTTGMWSDGSTYYISGYAYNTSTKVDDALLWTDAVPEPGTFSALAAGLSLVVCLRRRKGK